MQGNKNDIICWWSGGITSAVADKLAIDLFGLENCRIIMIDTYNEDEDTYRFKYDCEKWYGKNIETISAIPEKYNSIEDVWEKYASLNIAHGAICSTELKREVRVKWQSKNYFKHQIFGFEFDKKEFNRAMSMKKNYPKSKPIFPLLMCNYDKNECAIIIKEAGIKLPNSYNNGFKNNNCFNTGCVQGGIGYWQKMKREYPDKFYAMAEREHKFTNKKGKPVTMLKDQGKEAKETGNKQVFLIKHPDYKNLKCIDDMPECEVEPLMECNGHCGINDLIPNNKTFDQLNLDNT